MKACSVGGVLLAASFLWPPATFAQAAARTAALTGRVVDAQTGEPLGHVQVRVLEARRETLTGDDGRFELCDLPDGPVRTQASTVGYGVAELRLVLTAQAEVIVEIALGPETIRRGEDVVVAADAFAALEGGGPEYNLNVSEIKNLASVVADDPLRSVHSLPGVAADDDFHATFACRGLGFAAVGFYIDGVLTTAPFHTIRDDEESLGGSITILSGDLVESLSLMGGGAPARYGDRIGSVLSIRTREGAPKLAARLNLSLAGGASATVEGPWPGSDRGAWIVSARKSYLGYVTRRVADETPLLDYYDLQAKASFKPSPAHRLSLFTLHGDFDTQRRNVPRARLDREVQAHTRTSFGRLQWEWLQAGKGTLTATLFSTFEEGAQRSRLGATLAQQESAQSGTRVDLSHPWGARHRFEAGFLARQLDEAQERFTPVEEEQILVHDYDAQSGQPGAYVQDTWTPFERVALTAALRTDRLGATGETVWMPRGSLTVKLASRTTLAASAGDYGQFPRFVQLLGLAGNPRLRAERARHVSVALEHDLGRRARLRVEVYDQRLRHGLFAERRQSRLLGDLVAREDPLSPLHNVLRGQSRGVEVLLQRRSANGVSGWVSYAFGHAHVRGSSAEAPGAISPADFDQPHTVNVYLSGRVSRSVHLSTKYRYGSGFPLIGFYGETSEGLVLGGEHNLLRRKGYGRWDVRVNKAIVGPRLTFTLYAEVMNLLNQRNVRVERIDENYATREVAVIDQRLFPILPAVGLAVEF